MSGNKIDFALLSLDELGRVVLSDEMLMQIQDCSEILSSGANWSCNGTTNSSCTNNNCGNSTNGSCTNNWVCPGTTNSQQCIIESQLNNGC